MSRVLAGAAAALVAVVTLLLAAVAGALGATGGGGGASASGAAVRDIPVGMLALYQRAAVTCPGLDWAVLAAVGKIETNHGRARLPGVSSGENQAGAAGPMQFLAPTFAEVVSRHPPPPGGARPPSRYNAHDAVHAAVSYLCDSGAGAGDIETALFTYNRSRVYVADVLDVATGYRTPGPPPGPGTGPGATGPGVAGPGSARGVAALSYAHGQLGLPYLWGGDGPTEGGFDCSGLTRAAWTAAGVELPRTAQTQYRALPPIPLDSLAAGDLIFFGTPDRVHHVGIATGRGTTMIHAPTTGDLVRVADATDLPDLLSAARPDTAPPGAAPPGVSP